jgi:hypothetical protein
MPIAVANVNAYQCMNLMNLSDEYRETTGKSPKNLEELMKMPTTSWNGSMKQDVDQFISSYAPTILFVDSKKEEDRAVWCRISKNADSRWVRYQWGVHIAKGQTPPSNAVVWWTPGRKRTWSKISDE